MIVILPASLLAEDTSTAMLRSRDGVLLNHNNAPASSALFVNDLIETQKGAVARIEATGSVADIDPETMVQFEGEELVLDHGSLSVETSRGLRVRVGCITITPATTEWTHYEVQDVNGRVVVSALQKDVNIDARSAKSKESEKPGQSERVTVREGEQKSREEKCGGGAILKPASRVPGVGAILNSVWAKGAGMAAIGGLTCWALCQNDNPMSPHIP